MMADPARIKVEDASERPTSANEEKINVKAEPDDAAAAATSPDENKEPSSQEHPKQEQNSVSVYRKLYIVLVEQVPYIIVTKGRYWFKK